MDLELYDKVVLVTGSTRGLGLEIAGRFLSEGSKVVISGRHKPSLAQALKQLGSLGDQGSLLGLAGDLTTPGDVQRCVKQVLHRFGRLDILVANLGSGSGSDGWDAPDELWDGLLRENLMGSVRI